MKFKNKSALLKEKGGKQSKAPGEISLPVIHNAGNVATLIDIFEQQVEKNPDQIAVVYGEKQLTYSELNKLSNQLADYLRQQFDADTDDLIGLKLERSEWMIVAVLGILKTGAAFVPVDPAYPKERIDYICADSACKLLIDHEKLELFNLKRSGYSQENLARTSHEDSLAYCIYTSGSTGYPKGVLINHKSIVNYVRTGIKEYISDNPSGAGSFMHMSLAFDASLTALFVTLLCGKTLVVSSAGSPLEVFSDINFVKYAPYDFLKLTPAQFTLLENSVSGKAGFATAKYIVGGEALYNWHFKFLKDEGVPANIINEYGPTEATVGCISYSFNVLDEQPVTPYGILIGHAMENVNIYILNEKLEKVSQGEKGEIYIGGVQLAKSYLNKPELYKERFIRNPFSDDKRSLIYKSGDLGAFNSKGQIEYWGRKDQQVKILGNRIELGEIEFALQALEGVKQAVVMAVEETPGQKRLVAYIQSSGKNLNSSLLRNALMEKLPNYMLPSVFIILDEFPLNANGKVDRDQLPKVDAERPELATLYRKPGSETEINLANIWSSLLQYNKIGIDDNFFELGGNSLLALKMVSLMKSKHNYYLPIAKLYQFPHIAGIAGYLKNENKQTDPSQSLVSEHTSRSSEKDVAIIGMTGRFPGSNNVEELWETLKSGKETISFFTKEELDRSIPGNMRNDPDYVGAKGLIDDADKFDAEFFGLNPKLAELMDPQHRVFMEIVWELLEKTGYQPQKYTGLVGVYAGTADNTYFTHNILGNNKYLDSIGIFQLRILNEKDYIASRTSYHLNLKGPAVSVHSACSSSLLAISQAVESIRNGQCDVAVAGGASVTSPLKSGHISQDGGILSMDGHCRPFDAKASGTVFSDGAGVVLLKSLSQAEKDGDTILAVIKGIGVNNDGGDKGSFMAPSVEGQAGAIKMALKDAGVKVSSIDYVEAHGTGTPLGDPIEIEGLKMAFAGDGQKQHCTIGSIKSNIGHLMAAAGVAGLIKTVLAMNHRQIPPTAGYNAANPNIDFENSPFKVNSELVDWPSENKRRAGVSSFGVGGTNVHVILEEYPYKETTSVSSDNGHAYNLITWSAKSVESRDNYARKLSDYIRIHQDYKLADIAYSLQNYRTDFNHRKFVVASSNDDFLNQLLLENVSGTESKSLTEIPREIVFSFPGQGAQYLNMGRELYEKEVVFKDAIDECAAILQPYLKLDIRKIIYTDQSNPVAEEELKNTRYTQPSIFITEYALSKLWMSWGITPSILCGHSIGEFVAALLAGIFTLEDALKLIATRGQMVSELPKGSMLSVRLEFSELTKILPAELSIGAINNKKLCVVAGADEYIAMFSKKLDLMEIPNKVLLTSHAFHSAMMDPIVNDFKEIVRQVKLSKPQKPIISSVSGTWMTDEQATDPQYWADHLRKTVKFADVLDLVGELDSALFLEAGPGNVTSTLARQQIVNKKINVVTSMVRSDSKSEYYTLLIAMGQLWINGLEPDWEAFYKGQKRLRLNLPAYAFAKTHCWIDPVTKMDNMDQYFPDKTDLSPVMNIQATQTTPKNQETRKDVLFNRIKQLLEDVSGLEMNDISPRMSFIEIGLDSLLLTQVALTFKKEFKLPVTFRQLSEAYNSPALLIDFLDQNLPKEAYAESTNLSPANPMELNPLNVVPSVTDNSIINMLAQQIQHLSNQVALMQNGNKVNPGNVNPQTDISVNSPVTGPVSKLSDLNPEEAAEIQKPFGATARIDRHKTELNDKQADFLQRLTERYNNRTQKSKTYNQDHRAHMADPRVVSGFKPLTKEIVYPIVINKSSGSKLWDIDGNEYIDALNGFGSNMFGWQPEFIKKAIHEQVDKGYEVGPQHELAGEVCSLICELTGHERAALCSTGSEAVLGAMRIARTVTGRSLIVAFTGSYHGIVDEVLVRGTKKLKSFPAASGIMPEAVQNMLVLDYGTEASLRIIAERAHEIAAVLVEPVQSRRPEFAPVEFLKQVRKITSDAGAVLIFDEVITGFRMHIGGAQAMFGIKADIATYGKVVGAGIPIGVIAGNGEYMDALDGGFWQYGDESFPEIGVTYFAGTFVRHPLALASAKAALNYMQEKGPGLQTGITNKAKYLAGHINKEFMRLKLPVFVAQFGSLWKIKYHEEIPYSELLFTLMREKGIHIWDGFPCFMTEAHTVEEVDLIIQYLKESIHEMMEAGFFVSQGLPDDRPARIETIEVKKDKLVPPVTGAKLGRDQNGNPAWFVHHPDQPGKFIQLNSDSFK